MQLEIFEIWKDIESYEGLYQISNFGRVRSLDVWLRNSLNGTKRLKKGKLVSLTDNGRGYKIASLSNLGRKNHYIHRLVAKHFIDNKNKHNEVNHLDGDKSNNNYYNLEWCSKSENCAHASKIGLIKKLGEKPNAIKVINTESYQIFECIKSCSDFYGIKYSCMKDFLNRKSINIKNKVYKNLMKLDTYIETHPSEAQMLGFSIKRLDI